MQWSILTKTVRFVAETLQRARIQERNAETLACHAMPIEYQRDDRRRLITVTLTEPFAFEELLSQTDRQFVEQTWDYAVLYDARETSHINSPQEIQQIVDHTRSVGKGEPRGPVGVAIPRRPDTLKSGLQLVKVSGPLRDIEILLTEAQIEAWLARHAHRRG